MSVNSSDQLAHTSSIGVWLGYQYPKTKLVWLWFCTHTIILYSIKYYCMNYMYMYRFWCGSAARWVTWHILAIRWPTASPCQHPVSSENHNRRCLHLRWLQIRWKLHTKQVSNSIVSCQFWFESQENWMHWIQRKAKHLFQITFIISLAVHVCSTFLTFKTEYSIFIIWYDMIQVPKALQGLPSIKKSGVLHQLSAIIVNDNNSNCDKLYNKL